jgi:hypothetical protein
MCAKSILVVFDRIQEFLAEAKRRGLCLGSVEKMSKPFENRSTKGRFLAELQFCSLFGASFFHAGYQLEGDGFCLPFVQHHLSTMLRIEADWKQNRKQHGDVTAPMQNAREKFQLYPQDCENIVDALFAAGNAVFEQFDKAIIGSMGRLLPLFRASGVFHPGRLEVELQSVEHDQYGARMDAKAIFLARLRLLTTSSFKKAFLHVGDVVLQTDLAAEYPQYLRLAGLQRDRFTRKECEDTPIELWNWWRSIAHEVPKLFGVASILVLAQPSSAAIERFYSKVKANTDATQGGESQETFAGRCMAMYNKK